MTELHRDPAAAAPAALTPEDVSEFQRLVSEATGLTLSAEDEWDRAIELIALVRMLIRPDAEDHEHA